MTDPVAGLRTALAMFTALPLPRSWHPVMTRERAVAAIAWLPLLGAVIGALAGLAGAAVLGRHDGARLLAAAVGIAVLAGLTRALHLDGLADTADGLGSHAPAERALEIMRRSDIGPFGVLALVLVVLIDVAALEQVSGSAVWTPCAALTVAAATARLAVLHATVPGPLAARAARPDGFGALVAGGGSWVTALLQTALVLGGGAALAGAVNASVAGWLVAQVVALVVCAVLRIRVSARLGGVTGDVFGAMIEVATAVTLFGLALA